MESVNNNDLKECGQSASLSAWRLYAMVLLGYSLLSVLFFNRILAGGFYDHTSFLSIWQPWASVIENQYLINPVLSDQTDAMIPRVIKFFGSRSWWQPENAFGLPVFALLGGFFFPMRAVFLLFDTQTGITVGYLLSTTLSGFLMFVFLKDYKISLRHAFLGGVLYMFTPQAIATIGTTIGGNILPMLPLYFLAIKKIVRQRFRCKLLFFSLVSMLLVLSGFPSLVAFILYLGGVYFLALWAADRSAAQKGGLVIYVLGTLCGFAMTAFVLLPTIEFLRYSADVAYRHNYWMRHLSRVLFLHLFNPYFAATPALGTWNVTSNLVERALYMGIIPWLVAPCAIYLIVQRRERDFYFFLLAALGVLVIVFNIGYVKSLLRYLPVFSHHPATRMKFLLPFLVIPPCMLALDYIVAARPGRERRTCARLSVVAILMFVLSSLWLYVIHSFRSLYYVSFSAAGLVLTLTVFALIHRRETLSALLRKRWIHMSGVIVAAGIILCWILMRVGGDCNQASELICLLVRSTCGKTLWPIWIALVAVVVNGLFRKPAAGAWQALTAIVFLDLFLYTGFYNTPTRRETFYPQTPETKFLRQHIQTNERIMSIGRSFLPNCHLVYGIPSIQARGLTSAHYKRLMQQIDPHYLARRGTSGFFRHDLDIASPLLDLFNVKYLLAGNEFDLERHSIVNQFNYNSKMAFTWEEEIVQTFTFDADQQIEQVELRPDIYLVRTPLEIEASVWSGATQLGADRQVIEPDGPHVFWLRFSLPLFLEGGRDHELRLSIRRRLEPEESFNLLCVKGQDLFRQGELIGCGENRDLTFRLLRSREASVVARWKPVHDGGIRIFENISQSNRGIHQVERIEWVDDVEDYVSRIGDQRFLTTAYLPRDAQPDFDITDFTISDSDSFEIVEYKDHSVKIKVNAQSEAFIKIPDTYYPGWTARVNGERINIYRTDLIFRGLRLPAGEYILELRYVPKSLLYGGLIAVVTFFGLILLEIVMAFVWCHLKRKG